MTADATPDSLRSDLTALAKDGAAAAAAGERIKEGAAERRATINARLAELRKTAIAVDEDGDEYQALLEERGRLDQVLAR